LHKAESASAAMLVKIVENLFRYNSIVLANSLTAAFSEFDMPSILRLAATKWNMDLFYPSLGVGGYCIPIAKHYAAASLSGADRERIASIGASDDQLAQRALGAIAQMGGIERVAVLGVAYAPGLKVHVRSPGIALCGCLRAIGKKVLVHDPLYSRDELKRLTQADVLDWPHGLADVDAAVLVTPHDVYVDLASNIGDILPSDSRLTIVDNGGIWHGRALPKRIHYLQVGSRGFFG
jgi:UDP-N-acetyl-D-mannosaminuronate dehydrogenase